MTKTKDMFGYSALFWCYAFGQLASSRLGAFFGYKRFMMVGVVASAVINVIMLVLTLVARKMKLKHL